MDSVYHNWIVLVLMVAILVFMAFMHYHTRITAKKLDEIVYQQNILNNWQQVIFEKLKEIKAESAKVNEFVESFDGDWYDSYDTEDGNTQRVFRG